MIRESIDRWFAQRLPATDTAKLGQRNIYIVPTKAGFFFGITLLIMLVAAINYQLSLGYILTFLLAGAGAVSMQITHGTLRGLTLHLRPPAPGFAGDPALLEVVLTNPGRQRNAIAVFFRDPAQARAAEGFRWAWCDVPAEGQETVRVSFVPERRGWHPVPPLVVETVFPFGLFRAWTIWRPASQVLAWPKPEYPPPPLPGASATATAQQAARIERGGEFDGVRAYRRGDSMRQVVWKKVARTGQLVSRETRAAGAHELWLEWLATGGDPEQRLARLAAWVQKAEQDGLAYGLRLPGSEVEPAHGESHRRTLLDKLATY